jgi:hypothetical protein
LVIAIICFVVASQPYDPNAPVTCAGQVMSRDDLCTHTYGSNSTYAGLSGDLSYDQQGQYQHDNTSKTWGESGIVLCLLGLGSLVSALKPSRKPASSPPFASHPSSSQVHQPSSVSALEILQQRYARGEIDLATFQRMRALLEK